MIKPIYLTLSDYVSINNSYSLSCDEIALRSGFNLGNFVFRYGLSRMIDLNSHQCQSFNSYRKAEEGSRYPVIISCANWLGFNESSEKSNKVRYDSLKSKEARLVPYGLGVQNTNKDLSLKFGTNTKNLLSLLSERSNSISVRDEYSAHLLEKHGIRNTVITGCPSNFISYENNLGSIISSNAQSLRNKKNRNIKHLIYEYSQGNDSSYIMLKKLAKMLKKYPSSYIVQSPDMLKFINGECGFDDVPHDYKLAFRFKRYILDEKLNYFTDVVSWLEYAKRFDLSWGMRLHGNIVSTQVGVPSLIVTHDSRTEGLASVMGIPNIPVEKICRIRSSDMNNFIVNTILEQIDIYDKARAHLYKEFVSFNEVNEVKMLPKFLGMFNES